MHDKMNDNTRGQLLQHKSNGVYIPTTEPRTPKWGFLLTFTAFSVTIGIGIPVGYNIGVMNSPAEHIQRWCNETLIARYGLDLGDSIVTLWSTIISIFLVGGCIGSLFGATLADKFGRKGALLTCGILFSISAILFYLCRVIGLVELILLGQFIVGFSSGIATAVLGMYLSEILPSELRGTLAVFSGFGVTAGVVVAQIVSLEEILGSEEYWHYALSFFIILVIVFCFLPYTWLPESPKYLYIVAGKRDEARKELMRLRVGGRSDDLLTRINAELIAMEQYAATQAETRSLWSVLTDKTLLLPIVLMCALQGGQQLSGINAVFYYSVEVFKKIGLSETNAKWANFGAGLVNLLVAFSRPKVMEKINRRPIIIYSCLFSSIFLVVLSFTYNYIEAVSWFPYVATFSVFAYIIAYQIGLGPIPYFIGSELFDISTRPAAMSLGSLASWFCNFYIGMTFLPMQNAIGAFVFLPFAVVCFLLVILMFVYLTETRGREPADVAPLVSRGFRSRRS